LAAPKEIEDLVEWFEQNIESYKSSHYNETQVRREFVDPFFEALGWDVNIASLFSTHPGTEERIKRLQAMLFLSAFDIYGCI